VPHLCTTDRREARSTGAVRGIEGTLYGIGLQSALRLQLCR
jgi:hypothetical protein